MSDESSTFMERYGQGRVTADEIDDYVDRWHERPEAADGRKMLLHEFLGMTRAEYQAWVHDASILPKLARVRAGEAA